MGKGRKQRHFDRNAYRGMTGGPPVAVQTMGGRRAAIAMPLPPADEPLVTARKPIELPPRSKSKYPAKKKSKRAHWTPPVVVPRHDPVPAPPQSPADAPAPVLLLTYRPRPDPATEAQLAAYEGLLAFDPFGLFDLAPAIGAVPPPPRVVVAADAPIPRAAAVTAWRRRGPLDIVGSWLRGRGRALQRLLAPSPRKGTLERRIGRLEAENAALRDRLRRLEATAA